MPTLAPGAVAAVPTQGSSAISSGAAPATTVPVIVSGLQIAATIPITQPVRMLDSKMNRWISANAIQC